MTDRTPLVTLGMPVFNAERFLAESIQSLLAQTFTDFELLISDNASTDGTDTICRWYAEHDPRVRYRRGTHNRGASWNHTVLVGWARGRYFKWAAADDVCAPTFLERCVEVLEHDQSAVLCLPATREIDDAGNRLDRYEHPLRLTSHDVVERWTDLLMIGYACYHVYGVLRTEALEATGLMGAYIESDMVLLAELALHGRFAELDEELFLHRLHGGQSVNVHASHYDRGAWFDTKRTGRPVFPTWRFAREYVAALARGPLHGRPRRACAAATARWAGVRRRSFARDLKVASRMLTARRPA